MLCAIALGLAVVPAAAAVQHDGADQAATQRIVKEVPALLTPDGSIVSISVTTRRGERVEPTQRISDPRTIALIADSLKRSILQGRFQIGHQFHSPAETREIVFVHKQQPPLKLLSVGESMFWMSWGPASGKPEMVNFQSVEFDDFSAEYFRKTDDGPAVAPDFSLRITRRGCEGRCPEYSVAVDARGTVTWIGRNHVHTIGDAKTTLSRSQVHSIIDKLHEQRLLAITKNHVLCVDTPSAELQVTLDHKSLSILSDACAWKQVPEGRSMAAFMQYAESVMGVEHWARWP